MLAGTVAASENRLLQRGGREINRAACARVVVDSRGMRSLLFYAGCAGVRLSFGTARVNKDGRGGHDARHSPILAWIQF